MTLPARSSPTAVSAGAQPPPAINPFPVRNAVPIKKNSSTIILFLEEKYNSPKLKFKGKSYTLIDILLLRSFIKF